MASVFGHGIVGFTLAKLIDNKNLRWLMLAAIFSTILPDVDVFGFRLGIPYESPLGHRGVTHSILFAVFWSLLLMCTLGKKHKLMWFLVIFLSTLSHALLDAITTGGEGVGFFIPFENSRYFFNTRVIRVSPLSIGNFFTEWGFEVIVSELKYIVIPCSLILLTSFMLKKFK
ncbi:inner membrane protein [Hyunsoonleella jejuensis]|uniref:Inner membrane protein n=1 Tax=Hyunsoonleella jejuensis TaxID=419940 RepID=A0A1H9CLV8_9FLAO|nr:metal-dependent hydrolase [Hyunsoonleella jejuensis]SEQ02144.1 inner membrane protein [Hyunsoonleella jejuensis]